MLNLTRHKKINSDAEADRLLSPLSGSSEEHRGALLSSLTHYCPFLCVALNQVLMSHWHLFKVSSRTILSCLLLSLLLSSSPAVVSFFCLLLVLPLSSSFFFCLLLLFPHKVSALFMACSFVKNPQIDRSNQVWCSRTLGLKQPPSDERG